MYDHAVVVDNPTYYGAADKLEICTLHGQFVPSKKIL